MKTLLVLSMTLFAQFSLAWESEVIFKEGTMYTISEQGALKAALQKLCPVLFDGNHRSDFKEELTSISQNPNHEDRLTFLTTFSYETDEGGRFGGTLSVSSKKSGWADEVRDFQLVDDSLKVCP